jgi:hypothetical protein
VIDGCTFVAAAVDVVKLRVLVVALHLDVLVDVCARVISVFNSKDAMSPPSLQQAIPSTYKHLLLLEFFVSLQVFLDLNRLEVSLLRTLKASSSIVLVETALKLSEVLTCLQMIISLLIVYVRLPSSGFFYGSELVSLNK